MPYIEAREGKLAYTNGRLLNGSEIDLFTIWVAQYNIKSEWLRISINANILFLHEDNVNVDYIVASDIPFGYLQILFNLGQYSFTESKEQVEEDNQKEYYQLVKYYDNGYIYTSTALGREKRPSEYLVFDGLSFYNFSGKSWWDLRSYK